MLPTTCGGDARQVILMQALHDDDDGPRLLIVRRETRVPPYQSITRRRAAPTSLFGLERIVDDDRSAPSVSVPPTEWRGPAASGGDELGAGSFLGAYRKLPIPGRIDDHAELAMSSAANSLE